MLFSKRNIKELMKFKEALKHITPEQKCQFFVATVAANYFILLVLISGKDSYTTVTLACIT